MADTVLVTGASGTLGRRVKEKLEAAGFEVRAAGRRGPVPLDLVTGEGLGEAVRGASVIIHAATNPFDRSRRTDVEGTGRLLAAAREAGVRHLVYPGIVGSDRAQGFPYFRVKVAAEREVKAGGVPWTILRSTQFFELMPEQFFPLLARFGLQFVFRNYRLQPVEVSEIAEELVQLALGEPAGVAEDFGGPEPLTMEQMARSWSATAGRRRPIVPVPLPGAFGRQVRAGALLPAQARGRLTWGEWLRRQYPDRD